MSDELTNDQISQWLEVAAPCLFAAWQYGQTPDDADPVAWFAEVYGQGAPGPVHAVHVVGNDGRTVAVTGNGPRSAAHAKFMAWSNPGNVSKLLRDFRAMRERALAAERLLSEERAAHAETSHNLDAPLTALGAQVTPGGQTLAAGDARRVADGMRLARRAAKSAPAKCSCTHEAGDSWCLAHPTCAECGAATPSCVDSCADHVKPAPAAPARSEVPADVEAAIVSLVAAARDATNYELDRATVADHLTAERFVNESVANLRASIAAEIDRARAEGRAESPAAPATVGGLLATAPAGSVVEWMDDGSWYRYGDSLWVDYWSTFEGRWLPDDGPVWPSILRLPARLVPASEADADPASRGPIGGEPGRGAAELTAAKVTP